MARKRMFCCDSSRNMYEDYYKRQTGEEIPVFVGRRYQRGHGLGSVLGGLFRRVVPFIKGNAGKIGKQLLRTGMNIVGSVLGGKKIKEATKEGVSRGIKRTVEDLDWGSAHPHVRSVAPHLLRTGVNIAGDVISGKRFKEAAMSHGPEGIKRAAINLVRQKGSGQRRRRIKRQKRKHKDIFD